MSQMVKYADGTWVSVAKMIEDHKTVDRALWVLAKLDVVDDVDLADRFRHSLCDRNGHPVVIGCGGELVVDCR